tara:strand:+ start:777 stop:1100 length:324 start_codon:yes stop_codon:yes gene_type:complete
MPLEDLRIIFDLDGTAAVMIPAPEYLATLTGTDEEKVIHCADKRLPTGTKYEIIDRSVTDIDDRSFREAWEYEAGAAEKTSADLSDALCLKYQMVDADGNALQTLAL